MPSAAVFSRPVVVAAASVVVVAASSAENQSTIQMPTIMKTFFERKTRTSR